MIDHEPMVRWIRKALVALAAIAAVTAVCGMARSGGAKELARRSGRVIRFDALDGGLIWLEQVGGSQPAGEPPARGGPPVPGRPAGRAAPETRRILFLARGGSAPTVLAEGRGIADFSVRDAVYYVSSDAGTLARVPLTGGTSTTLQTGLRQPTAVSALDTWVCWTETQPQSGFSLAVLPLTRPLTLLRAMPKAGGAPRTLAVSDAAADVELRLLGEMGGYFYWLEHRKLGHPATLVKRVRLPGGTGPASDVETLASEESVQEGLLAGGSLYWTGGSREAAPPTGAASVNRRGADGRVELLGDWFMPGGALTADGGRVYYCFTGVYDLPGDAGMGRKLVTLTDSGRLIGVRQDTVYSVDASGGSGYRILQQPLRGGRSAARRGAAP